MRRPKILILFFWLAGILFPMAWLGQFWEGYRQIFNTIFAPEWMHYLMHAMLYAGLALLMIFIFNLGITPRSGGLIFGTILLVGAIQEGFQLLSGVQTLRWNSLLDLGIDVFGGVTGVLLAAAFLKIKKRSVNGFLYLSKKNQKTDERD